MTSRFVSTTDGLRLAVHESGNPAGPPVVAVHGFPDNHHVWDGVAGVLGDRYRVIRYDVRGAGESDQPTGRAAYRYAQLTEDFLCVLDAVSPDEPVHLLAHDWGSIQSWPTLADPRVEGRVASFTSISGPSIDHAGAWLRGIRNHPRAVLRQLGESFYVFLFQLPALPEWAARRGVIARGVERLSKGSHTADDVHRTPADSLNGINLYRANMLNSIGRPRPQRFSLPVQVIAPKDDPHVSLALQTEAPRPYVDDLRIRAIEGGHWVVAQRPELIVDCVEEFLGALDDHATVAKPSARHRRQP